MAAILDTVKTQANDIREAAEVGYARYRGNGNLSAAGILQGIAKTYLDAKTQMDTLQVSATTGATANLNALMTKVFGIDDLAGGDPVKRAATSMSYRDALDRAQTCETPEDALALLARANTVGDELLARAVAQVAWSNGAIGAWADVLDTFASTRPVAERALGELYDLNTSKVFAVDVFAFILPKPSELSPYGEYQIDGIANPGAAS
ncbi:MAG TPA: hypothetical protein VIJ96_01605 [Acidothermaceae bacterium]